MPRLPGCRLLDLDPGAVSMLEVPGGPRPGQIPPLPLERQDDHVLDVGPALRVVDEVPVIDRLLQAAHDALVVHGGAPLATTP